MSIVLLRKEVDKMEWAQYVGVECDSDLELKEDESDAEYFSDDPSDFLRQPITYDLEKMFEIVKKRDFNKWSLPTIHSHFRHIQDGSTGRSQLTR